MEYCKKLSSWDIYSVRGFPYRGRRKYAPDIHRRFNGSIIIQNDVFGLTILQFDREFKACLERRNQYEQKIMNIRFPDKTTNEYIEYLKYGDDTVESTNSIAYHMLTCEIQPLIEAAGTEIEIRSRQHMFRIIDKIASLTCPSTRIISSGSLAEGIDLPESDIDIMIELREVTVIDDLKKMNTIMKNTILLIDYDIRHPGFCTLKLIAEGYSAMHFIPTSLKETNSGIFISTDKFINTLFNNLSRPLTSNINTRHGPCLSDASQDTDWAFCFRSKFWPQTANNWIHRHRSSLWPTESIINSIVSDGCLLVPIGPKTGCDELLWRISFSLAEKRLSHSFNYTQLLCYILMKLLLKNIINRYQEAKYLLCSYFLKTVVFWLSEEMPVDMFKINNLSYCFILCIDKLMSFVGNSYCPNYFIPQHNMFIGKVDKSNNKLLLNILGELRNHRLKSIINSALGTVLSNQTLWTMTDKNNFSVNLDVLFLRVAHYVYIKNIEGGYKRLHKINFLMRSESSEFILDVLRFYYAYVNQQISQMIILPEHGRERNDIIRRCKKHLMDGSKTDAVSGWLLYASFYYVVGQYKKTIQIVDNVLSRCTPDMIPLCKTVYTTEDRDKYKHKTEGHLTLNHRMRHGTLGHVVYVKQSTLIPQELQLEVQDGLLEIPVVILGNALLFFSFQKLDDLKNKERALRQLYHTIKEKYFVPDDLLSHSSVVLGVCHEISGDRDTAYHCYNEALQSEHSVCQSAEKRIASLFGT